MGQKVNPHGLRVGVIKDWDSRWYAKDEVFGDTLVSDYRLRKYLKERLKAAGVPKIEIERTQKKIRVTISCAKPGFIIGRQGAEIEKLRTDIEKFLADNGEELTASVSINEIKQPDLDAQLVAENIARQLENRASFRRAMKLAIGRTMKLGARGIKVSVSGRLAGAEIARSEHYHDGTIPLQTIRADIDYGFDEANTTYGKIGVKVWIYKGEVLQNTKKETTDRRRDDRPRRDRRDGSFNRDRRDGNPNRDRRDGNPYRDRRDGNFRRNDRNDRNDRAPRNFNNDRGDRAQTNSSKKEDGNNVNA